MYFVFRSRPWFTPLQIHRVEVVLRSIGSLWTSFRQSTKEMPSQVSESFLVG